ncbi:unnamed protein product [Schistosoma margrebowiei]|uniref:Uncharacterized protein n=1 Tax=Schistosoma margrebowiei TaxID=48269 RepID=A0A183LAE5_9TREM|nr:unnamed protein product [Schistosoma margrebowiei]
MVVGGSQQKTMDPGFVLIGTRQHYGNLIVEFMGHLGIDRQGKPGQPSPPSMPFLKEEEQQQQKEKQK